MFLLQLYSCIYFKVAARGLDDGFATPTKINLKQKINCISLILHFFIKNTYKNFLDQFLK